MGVASPEERIFDTLAALRESTDNVREYLARAAELRAGADIPDRNGAELKLSAALAKAEASLGGKPLLFSDDKGMAAFETEVRVVSRGVWSEGTPHATRGTTLDASCPIRVAAEGDRVGCWGGGVRRHCLGGVSEAGGAQDALIPAQAAHRDEDAMPHCCFAVFRVVSREVIKKS